MKRNKSWISDKKDLILQPVNTVTGSVEHEGSQQRKPVTTGVHHSWSSSNSTHYNVPYFFLTATQFLKKDQSFGFQNWKYEI